MTDQVPTPAPQGDTPVPDAPKPPDGLDVKYWDVRSLMVSGMVSGAAIAYMIR